MTDGDDRPGRYEHLTFNAPLSPERADRIATRLAGSGPADVLDVGCGWGELLLRVLSASPTCTGVGVDTDAALLERGRSNAAARGVGERVRFVEAGAAEHDAVGDVVICVGSSHAFGGIAEALHALHARVRPGGRLLLGEGTWDPGAPADLGLLPDDIPELPDLAALVDLAVEAGFRPLYVETAGPDEWHSFESGYLADWEEWLMTHADHPDAGSVREQADAHRTRWLRGYRAGLGFAYLTLGVPRL
jgi:SAM-dependent methyltransferase